MTRLAPLRARGRPLPPFEEPWNSLRVTYLAVRHEGSGVLARLDLSFSEFIAMELCSEVPARVSEIAETIGITSAGATELIDRLERRRLVRRTAEPRDRRVVLIEPTPAGEQLFRRAKSAFQGVLRRLSAEMSEAERDALLVGLSALSRAIGREGD